MQDNVNPWQYQHNSKNHSVKLQDNRLLDCFASFGLFFTLIIGILLALSLWIEKGVCLRAARRLELQLLISAEKHCLPKMYLVLVRKQAPNLRIALNQLESLKFVRAQCLHGAGRGPISACSTRVTEETVSSRGWQQERLLSDVASNSAFFHPNPVAKTLKAQFTLRTFCHPPFFPFNDKKSGRSVHFRSSAFSTKTPTDNCDEDSVKISTRGPDSVTADFSKYLIGETRGSMDPKSAESLAKLPMTNLLQTPPSIRRRTLLDLNKEKYERILHSQRMEREKSRLKTKSNVYRALMGNVVICAAKFGAWLSSGSSGMLAEFIHSVVDCGNQALLLIGLRDSRLDADRKHPYGYGKSVYFWALVSALGTFFLGAGVSMTHAVDNLLNPSLHDIPIEVWGVLAFSFVVDGYVLSKTISETMATRPATTSYYKHLANIRDPATLAILLEDGAACLGVVLAFGGIAASHYTGNAIFDGVAGVGISALLGVMGIALVKMNHRFLLGQAVDREITEEIGKILLSRRSIDSIRSVQSQWTGPETFSYKAEVDFDGTYLAARLMPIYQKEFVKIRDTMDTELQVMLALYAEDVMRTVEREVRHVEANIRKKYPGAEYIELEPMSMDADRYALDDNFMSELKRAESDILSNYIRSMKKEESYEMMESRSPNSSTASSDSSRLGNDLAEGFPGKAKTASTDRRPLS